MNILVIPCWYPIGEDKIMGIYHKEFCSALSKNDNIHVDMLYINRERLKHPLKYLFMPKKEIIPEDGYNVYLNRMLDIKKISFSLQMKNYVKKVEKTFVTYLKHNPKPDIIHAMVSVPSGYAACILGEKYNIPVVITEHASYFERFFTGTEKKYGDYVLKHAHFTTVSNYMAKIMEKKGIPCEVLPNLVDTSSFKKHRPKIAGLRIITACVLRKGKRIEDIFVALKLILKDNPKLDVKMTIIGDGFLENYYKSKCHELEMDNYVSFVDRKNKEEIANLFASHNMLIISSDKETFAIPGIEALASGMPVVASTCGGPEEYLDDSCGKLYPPGDINALKDAILEVYRNKDNYDIKYLRSVADQYSADVVTKKALSIYKKLLK